MIFKNRMTYLPKTTLLVAFSVLSAALPAASWAAAPSIADESQAPADAPNADDHEECCTASIPDQVLAQVNGVKISRQEIDDRIAPMLTELGSSLERARRKQLDLLINGRLLEREAERRGTTTADLLKIEVIDKTEMPTEEEARALFDEKKQLLSGEFEQWRDKLLHFLAQERQGRLAKVFADRLRADADLELEVDDTRLSQINSDEDLILASLADHTISLADVDRDLTTVKAIVEQQIYQQRRQALNDSIDSLLIQQEAQRRKMTTPALMRAEVIAAVEPVTEKDILKFYAENQARLSADVRIKADRDAIETYLTTLRARQAQHAYAQKLRPSAVVDIYLSAPAQPVYPVSIQNQPTLGSPDAAVTVVLFADFECRKCAQLHQTLLELLEHYEGQIKIVARDFPLSTHPIAMQAAIAAEAARAQGRYWDYAALLYANQSDLSVEALHRFASQLELDQMRFDQALNTDAAAMHVHQDRQDALKLGIRSTPFLFVNGRPLEEKSTPALKRAIEDAFKAAKKSGPEKSVLVTP